MSEPICAKILLIGDSSVGKTSIVKRLCTGEFENNIDTTIGVEYFIYPLKVDNQEFKLQIWDTAGQEQYRSLSKIYYRNAVGVLCVFALDNHKSFESLSQWMQDARHLCDPNAKIFIIGNKADLKSYKMVTDFEIESTTSSYEVEYYETSAASGYNIKEVFFRLASNIKALCDSKEKTDKNININPESDIEAKSPSCCKQ